MSRTIQYNRVAWSFDFAAGVYNLLRMMKLDAQPWRVPSPMHLRQRAAAGFERIFEPTIPRSWPTSRLNLSEIARFFRSLFSVQR